MERFAFVGPGRVGLALGSALVASGSQVSLTYFGRNPEPPAHPLFFEGRAGYRYGLERPEPGTTAVLLTVPDTVLPELAFALAARGQAPPGCTALHCSGAFGSDCLTPLHGCGYSVGTLHPFLAVARADASSRQFRDAYFAISGEPEALHIARRIVSELGAITFAVPSATRPLYHAAAVMASNYLVALLHASAELLMQAGATPEAAEGALVSLARGTLDNVLEMGPERALTGPIMRGDADTIELHLRALSSRDATLYSALGRRTLDLVRGQLAPEVVGRLEELFDRQS